MASEDSPPCDWSPRKNSSRRLSKRESFSACAAVLRDVSLSALPLFEFCIASLTLTPMSSIMALFSALTSLMSSLRSCEISPCTSFISAPCRSHRLCKSLASSSSAERRSSNCCTRACDHLFRNTVCSLVHRSRTSFIRAARLASSSKYTFALRASMST